MVVRNSFSDKRQRIMLTLASLLVFMVFLESQCAQLPTSATVKVFEDIGDHSVRAYQG